MPDCEAAVAWYTSVLHYRLLKPVLHVKRELLPEAFIFKIFDSKLQEFKIAWLGTGRNGGGLELFEFIEPAHRAPEQQGIDYTRCGVFHISLTVPDPEEVGQQVLEAGGTRIGLPVTMPSGDRVVYCQDPWGTTLELLSAPFEQIIQTGPPTEP